jgi:hypothetical protein
MMRQARQVLMWASLLALLGYVSYLGFRAYLSPESLIGFANLLSC